MAAKHLHININQINPENEIFGILRGSYDLKSIPYIPYQFSKYGIGIIARSGIDVFEDIILESPIGNIRMSILNVESHPLAENGARYNLMAVGLDIDFEKVYASLPQVKQFMDSSRVIFARFQTLPTAVVRIKTFGSSNWYLFNAINASKMGIMVSPASKKNIPFQASTLIEFQIEANGFWLNHLVAGIGRIAHITLHEGVGGMRVQYFGLELKEFSGRGNAHWESSLEQLELQTLERLLAERKKRKD